MRIKEGVPKIVWSSLEKGSSNFFSVLAKNNFLEFKKEQEIFLHKYPAYKKICSFFKDKNFIIAGGSGKGIGYGLAVAILSFLSSKGALILITKDLKSSLEFETACHLKEEFKKKNLKFFWYDKGMNLKSKSFLDFLECLNSVEKKSCIYINTVASANSGILSEKQKPFYVKDIDHEGLFQWSLPVLDLETIQRNQFIMGSMPIDFIDILEQRKMHVEASVFSDFRGSLDESSRNPKSKRYGSWGAYSSNLYLPKQYIQKKVLEAYGKKKLMMDIFYPIMDTRALSLIPGGVLMKTIYTQLAKSNKIHLDTVPILALKVFNAMYKNLKGFVNPFPRLDLKEASLDLLAHYILSKLNNDSNSSFFYKNWI